MNFRKFVIFHFNRHGLRALRKVQRRQRLFELFQRVNHREIQALKILRQLLIEGEEPLKILAMITRQIRLLWKTKACVNEQKSISAQQLAGKISVAPRSAETLLQQAPRFSQQKLKSALKRIGAVDRSLKTSTNDPNILLEDLFIDLCM